eukprot:NODE_103_length_19640_cov_0.520905.p12 type:complete len:109 gc:universal NODE_103_length_19640_cov_0.520905:9642-9968(+)
MAKAIIYISFVQNRIRFDPSISTSESDSRNTQIQNQFRKFLNTSMSASPAEMLPQLQFAQQQQQLELLEMQQHHNSQTQAQKQQGTAQWSDDAIQYLFSRIEKLWKQC